jgi:hypothetical protein
MDEHIASAIESMSDDDREGIEALLGAAPDDLREMSAYAYSLIHTRRLLAYRIYLWLARKPEPTDLKLREDWLRIQNNACYLAVFHGERDERREIVDRALRSAPDNIAIYHNAACVLCKLGEADLAIAVVRDGITRGCDDATIRSMAEDDDLDLIRHTDEFREVIAGRGSFDLPSWAEGWSTWEYVQFRSMVRLSLPDPDMTHFEDGAVESGGMSLEIVGLADRCKGSPLPEWDVTIQEHFRSLLSP